MVMKPWLKVMLWWAATGGLLMFSACLWIRTAPEASGTRLARLTNPFLSWHTETILNLFGNEQQCFGPGGPLVLLAEGLLILITVLEWAVSGLLLKLLLVAVRKRRFSN